MIKKKEKRKKSKHPTMIKLFFSVFLIVLDAFTIYFVLFYLFLLNTTVYYNQNNDNEEPS